MRVRYQSKTHKPINYKIYHKALGELNMTRILEIQKLQIKPETSWCNYLRSNLIVAENLFVPKEIKSFSLSWQLKLTLHCSISTKDYVPWIAIRQAMLHGQHSLQDKCWNWIFNLKILFKFAWIVQLTRLNVF